MEVHRQSQPMKKVYAHDVLAHAVQKAGDSARTEVYAIEEWERVQAEAALAKEQEEAILVGSTHRICFSLS